MHNGNKIDLKLDLIKIQDNNGVSLYTYDIDKKEYKPLNIESIIPKNCLYDNTKLVIDKNKLICKYTLKEKIVFLLKKYHLYKMASMIYKRIRKVFIFTK